MLRDLLLSGVAFAPLHAAEGTEAGAAAPDPAPPAPPPAVDAEPAGEGDPPIAAGDGEPSGEPKPPHGNAGRTPWFLERINEETNKRRDLERQLGEEREARRVAEELAARAGKPAGDQQQQPQAPARQPGQSQSHYDAAVAAGVRQAKFAEDTGAVLAAGNAEFANFKDTLQTLTAVGATNDEFVEDVLAVDKASAHKLFDALAKDPDKTRDLVNMTSRQRIAALTRMAVMTETPKPAAPAAKPAPVSSAPAPKPSIEAPAATPVTGELTDTMSDEEFSAAWDRKHLKRA